MSARIRLGMVGGGEGAFIGAVHRIAARLDDHYELIAGALSSDAARALSSARAIGLAPDRSYSSFEEMALAESRRADGIEAVAIVTPNHLHFAAAKAFLAAGTHVICDKPLTSSYDDAIALERIVRESGKLLVLTHNYSGYPMVRQARAMVAAGELGAIRLVQVEYAQDWLSEPLERTGAKGAEWRTDPARAGAGGALGDIGTHAYQLAAFVTGLEPESVLAEVTTFIPGRALDDNAAVLLRYAEGARGTLQVSQVAIGNENEIALRVYGTKGGLAWHHRTLNELRFTPKGEPPRIITRSGAGASPDAARVSRIPGGHPEGYLEGFATIYAEAARAIRAAREGGVDSEALYPTASEGVRGLAFIDACLRSSRAGGVWMRLDPA